MQWIKVLSLVGHGRDAEKKRSFSLRRRRRRRCIATVVSICVYWGHRHHSSGRKKKIGRLVLSYIVYTYIYLYVLGRYGSTYIVLLLYLNVIFFSPPPRILSSAPPAPQRWAHSLFLFARVKVIFAARKKVK